ncbi:MAG: Gfo/Idh/MocA family oxidoreductase [Chloroflexi bacterium]|nr:Gfo/Idh/MocA family oxidoreductase [Chloroflexota bacterium]
MTSPTATPLGIGFVGCGRVAELHQAAIAVSDALRLVAIHDTQADLLATRAAAWDTRAHASLDALLADPAVEAVLVLTPHATHLEVARRVIEAGRHVFIEKPVSEDADAIDAVAAMARSAGLVAMPGHNYAYGPEFVRLHGLVQRGDLGDVRALFVTYIIRHEESVVAGLSGILGEVMVHHAYLTAALLGAPDRVHAGRAEPAWVHHDQEDQAWMTWEYPGGRSAHLFASFAMEDMSAAPWTFLVRALGTRGTAEMNWRSAWFERPLGTLAYALPAYEESYGRELAHFASAIRLGVPPVSSLEDAALVARLLAAAQVAADDRRAVERLEDGRRRW